MVALLIGEHAETLAREMHEGQTYHGTEGNHGRDFVDFHLEPGVRVIQSAGGSDVQQAIFWLHDSVEDTGMTLEELSVRGMPDEVVQGVDLMTHWPGQSYDGHLGRLATSPVLAGLKVVDSGRNLQATLELRRHMSPDEYDVCVRKYAGNVLLLGPQVTESHMGQSWIDLAESEMDEARTILDSHHGRTTASPATMLPRPSFAS